MDNRGGLTAETVSLVGGPCEESDERGAEHLPIAVCVDCDSVEHTIVRYIYLVFNNPFFENGKFETRIVYLRDLL